jgi:hypothetical protein
VVGSLVYQAQRAATPFRRNSRLRCARPLRVELRRPFATLDHRDRDAARVDFAETPSGGTAPGTPGTFDTIWPFVLPATTFAVAPVETIAFAPLRLT